MKKEITDNLMEIKHYMFENEQRPVTAPVNITALLTLLLSNGFDYEKYTISDIDIITDRKKYYGIEDSHDVLEFIHAFVIENLERLQSKERDDSKYIIPIKKNFRVLGREIYSMRKGDNYYYDLDGYNEDYIQKLFDEGELNIFDGTYESDEAYDTWDSETEIDSIDELVKEEVSRIKTLL
jgi:hypothetical protein